MMIIVICLFFLSLTGTLFFISKVSKNSNFCHRHKEVKDEIGICKSCNAEVEIKEMELETQSSFH